MDWIDMAQDREATCEHSNESSSSIKCWEILEWLRDWWSFKTDSATGSQLV
jgi:hypothetical protein